MPDSHGGHRLAERTIRSAAIVVLSLSALLCAAPLNARPSGPAQTPPAASHVTIPFLANASKPMDLDFQAGECDIDQAARTMACRFQQVFLTASPLNADTCLVTTNRYEQVFQKESDTRWTSREGPEGVCGVVDVTTLRDDGGVKWTLETRKVVTNKDAAPACRSMEETSETLSWQNLRRPLPCKFVQPGAISP